MRRLFVIVVGLAVLAALWQFGRSEDPDATRGREDPWKLDELPEVDESSRDQRSDRGRQRETVDPPQDTPVEAWAVGGTAELPHGAPASGAFLKVTLHRGYDATGAALATRNVRVDRTGAWVARFVNPQSTAVITVLPVKASVETDREDLRSLGHGRWLLTSRAPKDDLRVVLFPRDVGIDLFVRNRRNEAIIDARVFDSAGDTLGRTDRAGRLQLRTSSHRSTFEVQVHASGYEVIDAVLPVPRRQDSHNALVTMRRGLTLRGTVVDASDVPIPHALVYAKSRRPHAARSDAKGRFALAWLPFLARENTVCVEARGYLRAEEQIARYELTGPAPPPRRIRLTRGIGLRGTVTTAEAHPVRGARIRIVSEPRSRQHTEAISRDEGEFEFETVTEGASVLLCRAHDEPPFLAVATVPKSAFAERMKAVEVDLVVPTARRCAGKVHDANGVGISDATVEVWSDPDGDGPLPEFEIAVTQTGSGGGYRFEKLPMQPLVLIVRHEDHASARAAVEPARVVHDVKLGRAASITLLVRDSETKEGIEDFTVHLDGQSIAHSGSALWQSRALDRRARDVTVEAAGYATRSVRLRPAALGRATAELRLERAGVLEGHVRDAGDGRSVADATVTISTGPDPDDQRFRRWSRLKWSRATARTDAQGKFTISNATPGKVVVRVTHPDFARHTKRAILVSGRNRSMNVNLEPGLLVTGRFEDRDRAPVRDAHMEILKLEDPFGKKLQHREHYVARGDAHGRFTIPDRLSYGVWEVHAVGMRRRGHYVRARARLRHEPGSPQPGPFRLTPTETTRLQLDVLAPGAPRAVHDRPAQRIGRRTRDLSRREARRRRTPPHDRWPQSRPLLDPGRTRRRQPAPPTPASPRPNDPPPLLGAWHVIAQIFAAFLATSLPSQQEVRMSRKPRRDYPGALHHIFNRGVAKRSVFEVDADFRFFKSCLARAVRRDEVRIYAYSLLTNHFHLFVRSTGRVSTALHRVLNAYARWFNRKRGRDGPLWRGRFGSSLIEDLFYAPQVVCYIDANPVAAGLAERPEGHLHSSAHDLLIGPRPPWLSTAWHDEHLAPELAGGGRMANGVPKCISLRGSSPELACRKRDEKRSPTARLARASTRSRS